MGPGREFVKLMLVSALALLLVAAGVGGLLALDAVRAPNELFGVAAALRLGFVATLAFGAGPALLVGAPGYWLLWRTGRAGWTAALLLGTAAGSLLLVLEPALALWGAGCGAAAAAIVHAVARRWPMAPSAGPMAGRGERGTGAARRRT